LPLSVPYPPKCIAPNRWHAPAPRQDSLGRGVIVCAGALARTEVLRDKRYWPLVMGWRVNGAVGPLGMAQEDRHDRLAQVRMRRARDWRVAVRRGAGRVARRGYGRAPGASLRGLPARRAAIGRRHRRDLSRAAD